MTGRVIPAVLEALRETGVVNRTRVDRVTAGDAAILVELVEDDERLAGLAHRPAEGDVSIESLTALSELLAPVDALADDSTSVTSNRFTRVDRAVAVATLNALSAPFVDWTVGDPMATIDPSVETIVTVGLFRTAFRKFTDVEMRVIEREPVDAVTAPDDITLRTFTPDRTATAMAGADVVFVTGSALVYGGFERYLSTAPEQTTVVAVGATVSLLPGPLFDAGVDVVAGAEVTDTGRAREAVGDGSCGTALHDHGVRKVYTMRDRSPSIHLQLNP